MARPATAEPTQAQSQLPNIANTALGYRAQGSGFRVYLRYSEHFNNLAGIRN